MNTTPLSTGPDADALIITRVAEGRWHAVDRDLTVGRGHAVRRPDGRLFVSIDAWHDSTFDRLAAAMLAVLPAPLFTVLDETDTDLRRCWQRAGFAVRRREWEYDVATDPAVTGLAAVRPPAGVTIVPAGMADEQRLRAVDRAIREEVEATTGWWQTMPAEVLPHDPGDTVVDPSQYAVAAAGDRYLGLIRVVIVRRPRIGLLAVRADQRRRGVGRALLAHALGRLHDSGFTAAWAEAHESNTPATTLLADIGAQPIGSNLELVR